MVDGARISAIAALGANGVIGRDQGGLPWHIPEDSRRFRTLTLGHPLIVGRVTFEEFSEPLDGRLNIVVTTDPTYHKDGVVVTHSVEEAIAHARAHDDTEIFVGGGAAIFRDALDVCDRLYLTIIHADFDGARKFPPYPQFQTVIERIERDNGVYKYTFLTVDR
jgi:dihydrofolate reductase